MNRSPIRFLPTASLAASLFCAVQPGRADDTSAAPPLPPVAATVNGEAIPTQEWLTRVQNIGFNDFNANLRTRRLNAGQLALEQLLNERIIMQYSAKVGLTPSEAEVNREVEAQKALPAIKERLDQKMLTEAQLRYAVRYQRTLQSFITINQNISPEEVRAFYDAGYGRKWQVALIRASKKETAQQAYAALQKGQSFAAVAAQFSEDAETKKTGGELRGADGKPRWFGPSEPGLPPFVVNAVSVLKNPGDYTTILEEPAPAGTGSLYFIFQLLGRYKSNDDDFTKMRAQVEREALFAKALRSGAADKKLTDARREAKIIVNLPGYQALQAN